MRTVKVFWRDKFAGKSVAINAADFDPSIHRLETDGRWPKDEPEPEAAPVAEDPKPKKPTHKK